MFRVTRSRYWTEQHGAKCKTFAWFLVSIMARTDQVLQRHRFKWVYCLVHSQGKRNAKQHLPFLLHGYLLESIKNEKSLTDNHSTFKTLGHGSTTRASQSHTALHCPQCSSWASAARLSRCPSIKCECASLLNTRWWAFTFLSHVFLFEIHDMFSLTIIH